MLRFIYLYLMVLPNFPSFKILELSDKQEIERMSGNFMPYSDFHFSILWSWDIHEPVMISWHTGNLIIRQSDCVTGSSYYTLLGANDISGSLDALCDHIPDGQIKWIPEEVVRCANGHAELFHEDTASNDYIFDVPKLCEAPGSEFSSYRRKCGLFLRECPDIVTREINIQNLHEQSQLLDLFQRWTEQRPEQSYHEVQAFRKLLLSVSYFPSVSAICMYAGSELIGFAIIDIMNPDYACIPFIKATTVYSGATQYLMKDVARYLHAKGIRYINFEPDLGLPSLKEAKLRYKPVAYLKKYSFEKS